MHSSSGWCVSLHIRLWSLQLFKTGTSDDVTTITPTKNGQLCNKLFKTGKNYFLSIITLVLSLMIKSQHCLLQFYKREDHMRPFKKKNWKKLEVSDFKAVFRCFRITRENLCFFFKMNSLSEVFFFFCAYKCRSLIRLLVCLISYNKKDWMIALGRSKSHRVAQLLTLLSQPLTFKSCSDFCPRGGREPTEGMRSAHSPADIYSSQSSHSI